MTEYVTVEVLNTGPQGPQGTVTPSLQALADAASASAGAASASAGAASASAGAASASAASAAATKSQIDAMYPDFVQAATIAKMILTGG